MPDSASRQERLGGYRGLNRLAIAMEIVAVLAPMYLGLFVSNRIGSEHVKLSGSLMLKGGAVAYLGLAMSLTILWILSRLRGARWIDLGMVWPKSWIRTVLMGVGVALGFLGAIVLVINPAIKSLPNLQPRDMSSFSFLEGSLPNLMVNVMAMWVTAAFLEEFLWRGYLMNRLVDLLGGSSRFNWAIALVFSTIIFGLGHAYQGTAGMLKTGAAGLVLGLAYLIVGRNLWPLIIAHALFDTLDFVTHYLGG